MSDASQKRPRRFKPDRPRKPVPVPATFVPQFWADQDHRSNVVREVVRRYDRLRRDAGADSYQKELLAQRAVFLALRLESMEVEAARTGAFDAGVHTQMTNALVGLLRALGLARHVKQVGLAEYVADQSGAGE